MRTWEKSLHGRPGGRGPGDAPMSGSGAGELSETGYRQVFEASPDGIVIVDREGTIREVNPRAEEMFGYPREELLGREVEMLVPDASRSVHRRERDRYVEDPAPRPMGAGRELEGRHRDGTVFPVEISLSPVRTETGELVIATVRDLRRRQRLRDFGADALGAAEEERQRIARELHDDTAQRLSALLVRIRAESRGGDGDSHPFLEELRSEILEITEGVRRIARGLRPPALQDAGLGAALQSHVRAVADGASADVDLSVDRVDEILDQDAKLALYRIAQEALSNALRHSGAERVEVVVREREGGALLEVRDDGRGFDVRHVPEAEGRGLGILGMHERAHGAGGQLEIESAPDRGTTVRAVVPGSDD